CDRANYSEWPKVAGAVINAPPLLLGEKGTHRGQKLLGLLHRWRVPTAVDDVQRSVGQRLLVQLATIDRHDGILLAPDNERGGCDAAQIAGQVRVVKVRFPAQARGHL